MSENIFKKALKDQGGFMAIIALAMLMVMMIFGISLQMTVMDTYHNLKAAKNNIWADGIGKSVIEYSLYQLKDDEVGFNTLGNDGSSKVACAWGRFANVEGGGAKRNLSTFQSVGWL